MAYKTNIDEGPADIDDLPVETGGGVGEGAFSGDSAGDSYDQDTIGPDYSDHDQQDGPEPDHYNPEDPTDTENRNGSEYRDWEPLEIP
jgi:hypothetical protein